MISITVINNTKRNIPVGGRVYFNGSTEQLVDINRYKLLKKYKNLDIEVKDFKYDNLKDLSIEELRVMAEFYNIENYWLKNKGTLVKELKIKKGEVMSDG